MADHAGPAAVTRPAQALPPRQLAVPWIAVAALAAVAWAVTVVLARKMGNGPGTMGLALLPFLGLWIVMMAAMMLPSVAPVAVMWTRLISGASDGPGRVVRMSVFLAGYLLTWAAVGIVAFGALVGTGRLLTASPVAAKWLGVAIFITARGQGSRGDRRGCQDGCVEVLSSRVLLRPADLGRSRRFYRDVLGLAVFREFGSATDPSVVFFLGQGLLEVSGQAAGTAGNSVLIWLQVRDVRAEHERLAAAGARILREPAAEPWGLTEMWIEDPDGVRIVLVEVPADHPLRRDPRSLPPPG